MQTVTESMMNTLEVDEIANLLEAKRWPSSDDLTMSNVAFLTIQEMQNMKPHEAIHFTVCIKCI